MDNHSLEEVTDAIVDRLSPLGLYLEGNPTFHAAVNKEFDDSEDDEGGDEEDELDMNSLIDKLKDETAHAVIHMTFATKKLAWEDSTLHPKSAIEDVTGISSFLPSEKEIMQKEIDSYVCRQVKNCQICWTCSRTKMKKTQNETEEDAHARFLKGMAQWHQMLSMFPCGRSSGGGFGGA